MGHQSFLYHSDRSVDLGISQGMDGGTALAVPLSNAPETDCSNARTLTPSGHNVLRYDSLEGYLSSKLKDPGVRRDARNQAAR